MSATRLDPDHPKAVPVTTKFGATDAQRVTELANQTGVGRSEYIRQAVLRELEREDDEGPPEPDG
jgi:hypothetical protein